MTRRTTSSGVVMGALLLLSLGTACGDVTSNLITGSPAGSGGASPGGSGPGGSSTGGTGGSSAGGAAGGSSQGGASGLGGMPECMAHQDCTDSERRLCEPIRNVCVECFDKTSCELDEDCNVEVGECGNRCTSMDDCIEEDDPFCSQNGFCVECLGNADCPSMHCDNSQCID